MLLYPNYHIEEQIYILKCFLEFQYVLLMEIQKLTKIENEILEQLILKRLLAMVNTVRTQNMDTLEPVTTMQEFDVEGDNLKDQLNRKSEVRFFSFCF